ncbi:hypothetical protein D3C72_2060220 [compost metagenome]
MHADAQPLQRGQHAEVALGARPVVGHFFDGADQGAVFVAELQGLIGQVGAPRHAQHLQHAGRIEQADTAGVDAGERIGNAAQHFGRVQRGMQGPVAGQPDQAGILRILFEMGGLGWRHGGVLRAAYLVRVDI